MFFISTRIPSSGGALRGEPGQQAPLLLPAPPHETTPPLPIIASLEGLCCFQSDCLLGVGGRFSGAGIRTCHPDMQVRGWPWWSLINSC